MVFYGYAPNSKQDADFDKVGVELKVTPFEKNCKGRMQSRGTTCYFDDSKR